MQSQFFEKYFEDIEAGIESTDQECFLNSKPDDYKICPNCGQGKIPFKKGVCICGKQIGKIQYIKNTQKFVKTNYSNVDSKPKIEKLEIKELMDN